MRVMTKTLAGGGTYGFNDGENSSMNGRVIPILKTYLTVSLVNSGSRATDPEVQHSEIGNGHSEWAYR